MQFGQSCDLITIEIENVNTQALKALELRQEDLSQPGVIELIRIAHPQKAFYRDSIPTADFILVENRRCKHRLLSADCEMGMEGYDDRGVQDPAYAEDLTRAFDAPACSEKLVDFDKEVAVIVARNARGEVKAFRP